jgi:hypothetical protein
MLISERLGRQSFFVYFYIRNWRANSGDKQRCFGETHSKTRSLKKKLEFI